MAHPYSSKSTLREWRASWRDTFVLLREFQKPLLLFVLMIVGSGFLFHALAVYAREPVDSLTEAVYLVLTLTFLQPSGDFPHTWYLQSFYFLMPILGVGVLALGLADFGVLFFNRRARGKEWQMAVASTYKNHVVIIGLGHLGYRVVKSLAEMNQDMVVIESKPRPYLVSSVQELHIPVIEGDGTQETMMLAAGVHIAHSIILCTQNDSLNLQMALMARKINPTIEVIIRIFDDGFANELHKQFGFHAVSATGMAAPVFAAAAAGFNITPPIDLDGQPNCLASLSISNTSKLREQCINDLEARFDISIVMLKRNGETDLHPQGKRPVQSGDTLMVFGTPQQVGEIIHASSTG